MTRTVADAAAVFHVIVGYDPNDSITVAARTRPTVSYRDSLRADGLRGARIGVLTQAYVRPSLDVEAAALFMQSVADMRAAGAMVMDSVLVPDYDRIMRIGGACNSFPFDLAQYFAARGEGAPVRSVRDVLQSGKYHPTVQGRLQAADTITIAPENTPGCAQREAMRAELRTALQRVMDSLKLDAMVYPTWSNVPRLIGDLNTPHGDNSQIFSPLTGFPAITVPMGYTRNGTLPAGLSILGRPWSEGTLFRLAHAYEQRTNHRKAPLSTPRLARRATLSPQADSVLQIMGSSPIMQNPSFPAPHDAVYRIAWDVNVGPESPDKVVDGFRRPANFFRLADVNGVPRRNVHLALIVYGTATRSLLRNDAYKAATGVDNASAPLLEALHAAGVQIIVCGEALINRNVPRDQLLPFVQVATTATMARAILHTQGYATFQP
jgi:intracellular sulfur oxidation DsrE/DsrF family protein